jgi:hypothetical protein
MLVAMLKGSKNRKRGREDFTSIIVKIGANSEFKVEN